jgi:hypothetical protein
VGGKSAVEESVVGERDLQQATAQQAAAWEEKEEGTRKKRTDLKGYPSKSARKRAKRNERMRAVAAAAAATEAAAIVEMEGTAAAAVEAAAVAASATAAEAAVAGGNSIVGGTKNVTIPVAEMRRSNSSRAQTSTGGTGGRGEKRAILPARWRRLPPLLGLPPLFGQVHKKKELYPTWALLNNNSSPPIQKHIMSSLNL